MFLGSVAVGQLSQQREDPVDVGFDAGPHVEGADLVRRQRAGIGVRDVADVDKIAGLLAVAVDAGLLSAKESLGKDGHHAGFAMRILPRAIHIRIAQRRVRQPMQRMERPQINLGCELGRAVGRNGQCRGVLGGGYQIGITVDGAASRSEEEAADAVLHAGLQQRRSPQQVHAGVEHGVLDRSTDARLGGLVDDRFRPLDREELVQPGRVDVHLVEARPGRQLLDVAGRQVVQDHHLVAGAEQPIGDVRADEPRPAADQDLQRRWLRRKTTSPTAIRLQ